MFECKENSFRNVRWFMEYAFLDDEVADDAKHVDSYFGRTVCEESASAANPLVNVIVSGVLFFTRDTVFDAVMLF
tara:strand:+ start:1095 stop:1319 length:225 start_codon:yes stop_codon:yes gene_type:complete